MSRTNRKAIQDSQSAELNLITEFDFDRLSALVELGSRSAAAALLEDKLATASVIDPASAPPDLITMNSTFRGRMSHPTDKRGGNSNVLRLVFPRDANIDGGQISVTAPLGVRLIGTKAGQTIKWQGHDGSVRKMTIEEVLYQPEANGDWHL